MSGCQPTDESGVVRQSFDAGKTILIGRSPWRPLFAENAVGRRQIVFHNGDREAVVLEEQYAAAKIRPPAARLPMNSLALVAPALLAVLLNCAAAPPTAASTPTQGVKAFMTWKQIAQAVLAQLTDEERRSGIVYLDRRELPAGSTLDLDSRQVPIQRRSAMAFVDRVPQANWGHPARYLLIDIESGEIESIEAQFPPFLRGVPATLQVIWKGETVPDWAVATP